jgi:hypothetical protein
MAESGEHEVDRQRAVDAERVAPHRESTVSTVGTGSVLAIGCIVLALLLVLIALAYRWLGGTW